MEGDIQVRFYRDCIYTSQILQLEERPWSVSTAIVAVREPSRTGNRGAAAPIFWPGRRCLPELAEGDRKVGCRRPTFLKIRETQTDNLVISTWQSCIFRRSRTDGCTSPRHGNAAPRTGNRVILKIGRAVFWMAVNRKSRRAMMRSGESQKMVSGHGSNRNWKRTNGHSRPRCCSCRNRHRQRYHHPR